MTVPMTSPGPWVFDQRGEGRAVRVSAHAESGFLVLSTWKSDICVATVRLLPEEAAQLVSHIAGGLARLTAPPEMAVPDPVASRLTSLEARLAALEQPDR